MKRLAFILLAGLPTMAATDPPIVNVIGVTEFEVPAKDPTTTVKVLPPIALVIANDMTPEKNGATSMRAKLAGVSVGTAARPEYGKAFEFDSFAAGKKGELRQLMVTVRLTEIPEPQTYLVKVLLLRDGDPTVAPQALDLKVTRPAAT